MPDFWYLSSVSLKILSYFYKPKNMAILGNLWSFWYKNKAWKPMFSSLWQRYEDLTKYLQNHRFWVFRRTLAFAGFACSAKRFFESLSSSIEEKNRHPCGCLFSLGRGIRIRTLNNGVRVRCVTVTLYLYIILCFYSFALASAYKYCFL